MADTKRCPSCKLTKPRGGFAPDATKYDGLRAYCRDCYREKDRNRTRPQTAKRVLRVRAHNRARARLVEAHREEYERLLAEEVAAVTAEAQKLAQDTPPLSADDDGHEMVAPPVPLLSPGPRVPGQDVAARVRTDAGTCPLCAKHHGRKHRCPMCGTQPAMLTLARVRNVS